MAIDKPGAAASPAGGQAAPAFPIDTAWLKPLSDVPAQTLQEFLNFTADRFRAHADFLQRLAACDNPADAWKRQTEYLQSVLEDCGKAFPKLLKPMQDSAASTRPRA